MDLFKLFKKKGEKKESEANLINLPKDNMFLKDIKFDLPPLPPFKDEKRKQESEFELGAIDELGTSKQSKNFPKLPDIPKAPEFPEPQKLDDSQKETPTEPRHRQIRMQDQSLKMPKMPSYSSKEDQFKSADHEKRQNLREPIRPPEPVKPKKDFENLEEPELPGFDHPFITPPSAPAESYSPRNNFISVVDYQEACTSLEDVNRVSQEMEKTAARMLELEKSKSDKIKELQESLEEAERKVIAVDRELFQR